MKICDVINFGIFDSQKSYSGIQETQARKVELFEFDYIISCTKNSASYIDSDSESLFPGLLIVRKPGNISHSRLDYKCYSMHLAVGEGSPIYEELLRLPSYFLITNFEIYQNIFSDMFRHLVKGKENSASLYVYSKIFELLYYLKNDTEKNKKIMTASTKKETLTVEKAISYMRENFSGKISLKDLSELTGYSPNHFRSIFSSAMKASPQKYLEKLRINNAKFLLLKSELTISEIAYACGFSSQSYFTKAFKEVTMQTPGEFLKASIIRYEDDF